MSTQCGPNSELGFLMVRGGTGLFLSFLSTIKLASIGKNTSKPVVTDQEMECLRAAALTFVGLVESANDMSARQHT